MALYAAQSKPVPTDFDLQPNSRMQPWSATLPFNGINPFSLLLNELLILPAAGGVRLSWPS